MQCRENVETLSAWLDGELSDEESTRLERHMAGCSACRQAFEQMTALGASLTAASLPPLDPDFALKAASFVRERALPAGPPPRDPGGSGRKLVGFLSQSHPILALVGARRRRPGLRPLDMLKVVLLFGLPALFLAWMRDGVPLLNYLSVVAVGLMVAVPVHYFNNELAMLGGLIKGRCLEEVLGTSLEPTSTVDALATSSLRPILRACLPVAPVLIAGSILIESQASLKVDHAVPVALAWLPLTLVLFLGASYLALCWRIWARSEKPSLVTILGLGAGLLLTAAFVLAPVSIPVLGLLTVLSARWMAIRGLERPELVARANQTRLRATRNRYLRVWSDNPITAREMWRTAGSVPGGLAGLFAWRLTLISFPLVWAAFAVTRPDDWSQAYWLGVVCFACLLFLRAAYRTLGSVLSERHQKTWEVLLQTDLGPTRFLRGWLEVALHTVMLEGLVGAVTLTLFGWYGRTWITSTGDGERVALFVPVLLIMVTLVGALVGMALSASSRALADAQQRLALLAAKLAAGWLVLWGLFLLITYPIALVEGFSVDSTYWDDLVQHDAPLASGLAVSLAVLLWSVSLLRRELTSVDRPEKTARTRFVYPAATFLLEIGGLAFTGYASVIVMTFFMSGLTNQSDPVAGMGLTLLLGLLWIAIVRLPLASGLELVRGTALSPLVGGLAGVIAGLTVPLLFPTWRYLASIDILRRSALTDFPEWAPTPVLFLCIALGVIAGLFDMRAPRCEGARRRTIGRRLGLVLAAVFLVLPVGWLWSAEQVQVSDPAAMRAIRKVNGVQAPPPRPPSRRLKASGRTDSDLFHYRLTELLPDNTFASSTDQKLWRGLGDLDENQPLAELQTLLASPEGRRLEDSFRQQLPQLYDHLLLTGEEKLPRDYSSRSPNFILVRGIARSLAVLGLSEEMQGRPDAALGHYLTALSWGERFTGRGLLVAEMVATAVETIGLERLLVLETSTELTAEQYREILQELEQSSFRPQNLSLSMEREMLAAMRFLELPDEVRGEVESIFGLPLPRVYLRYEKVRLINYYLEVLPSVRELSSRSFEQSRSSLSPLALSLVPNHERAVDQVRLLLTRLEAARTVAALKLYRLERGHYPETLEALVGPYLKATPKAWINPGEQFDYRLTASSFELGCQSRGLKLLGNRPPVESWSFHPYREQRTSR